MDKAFGDEFFQGHLRKAVDVEGIPAHHQHEGLDLFGRAVRVCAVEIGCVVVLPDLRLRAADRAGGRNFQAAAFRQIFCDLGNDHVGLIHQKPVPKAQLQFLHDAEVVDAGPAHGGALQLHRFKDGHWIDEPRAGSGPLHAKEPGLRRFIRPLEGDGVSGEFRSPAQGQAIGDVLVGQHQAVGGEVVFLNGFLKIFHRFLYGILPHHAVLHHVKALLRKPLELPGKAVLKIQRRSILLRLHQGKGHEIHMPLPGHGRIQLPHGAGAEVSGIFIPGVCVRDLRVDLFKIAVADQGLSPQDEPALKGDGQGNVLEVFRVLGDDLPDLPVAPGDCLPEPSSLIGQHHRKAVQLPAQDPFPAGKPGLKVLHGLGFVQGQHGAFVPFLRQLRQHLIAHPAGGRIAHDDAGALLQLRKLVVKPVILDIGHDLPALLIVGPGRPVQKLC